MMMKAARRAHIGDGKAKSFILIPNASCAKDILTRLCIFSQAVMPTQHKKNTHITNAKTRADGFLSTNIYGECVRTRSTKFFLCLLWVLIFIIVYVFEYGEELCLF